MRKPAHTALVPYEARDIDLPARPERALSLDKARDYAEKARAERTRKEYARCWREFVAWCETNGRTSLPAGMDTVVAYISALADGSGAVKRKPLAISTINRVLAAIKLAHRTAGHGFNSQHPVLQEVWAGIRNESAKTRLVRRVRGISADDLREMLEMLRPDVLREARDAAVLALGWGGCRRRSEITGLDWQQLGDGRGILSSEDKGLLITLMTSKTSQDAAQEYIIARRWVPVLCAKIEDWIRIGQIAPGTPVLRAIEGKGDGKHVGAERLSDRHVSRIIKRRIALLLKARHAGRKKLSKAELAAEVERYAGHSMRVGHITDAKDRNVPDHHIQEASGHKGPQMIALYSRVTNKERDSSLKGLRGL